MPNQAPNPVSGHAHAHPHGHGHGHHAHAPASHGVAFAIGMALNGGFVVAEIAYGAAAGSLSLLADAGHNMGDVLAMGAAWLATVLGRRRPTARFTYGLRRSSILSALFNAVLLLVVTGAVAAEAVRRLLHPEAVAGLPVLVVAAVGIAVNGATALLFLFGDRHDLNIRAVVLHMAADAGTAAVVAAGGLLTVLTGWSRIDPALGLVVAALIVAGTWSLLRRGMALALDGVPDTVDRAAVERFLRALPGVADLHHLHIWGMSTTETALTAHLVRPGLPPDDALLQRAARTLAQRYGIGHATFQVENGDGGICALADAEGG